MSGIHLVALNHLDFEVLLIEKQKVTSCLLITGGCKDSSFPSGKQ